MLPHRIIFCCLILPNLLFFAACVKILEEDEHDVLIVETEGVNKVAVRTSKNFINLNVYLKTDSNDFIRIEGEKMLIESFEYQKTENSISFDDKNKWSVRYGVAPQVNMFWHCSNKDSIICELSNTPINVYSMDTIDSDFFRLVLANSFGEADLAVNNRKTNLHISGAANFRVSGQTDVAVITVSGSALADASELIAKGLHLRHNSSNHCYVQVYGKMTVYINYFGNVYYSGHTTEIELTRTGKGQLLELN